MDGRFKPKETKEEETKEVKVPDAKDKLVSSSFSSSPYSFPPSSLPASSPFSYSSGSEFKPPNFLPSSVFNAALSSRGSSSTPRAGVSSSTSSWGAASSSSSPYSPSTSSWMSEPTIPSYTSASGPPPRTGVSPSRTSGGAESSSSSPYSSSPYSPSTSSSRGAPTFPPPSWPPPPYTPPTVTSRSSIPSYTSTSGPSSFIPPFSPPMSSPYSSSSLVSPSWGSVPPTSSPGSSASTWLPTTFTTPTPPSSLSAPPPPPPPPPPISSSALGSSALSSGRGGLGANPRVSAAGSGRSSPAPTPVVVPPGPPGGVVGGAGVGAPLGRPPAARAPVGARVVPGPPGARVVPAAVAPVRPVPPVAGVLPAGGGAPGGAIPPPPVAPVGGAPAAAPAAVTADAKDKKTMESLDNFYLSACLLFEKATAASLRNVGGKHYLSVNGAGAGAGATALDNKAWDVKVQQAFGRAGTAIDNDLKRDAGQYKEVMKLLGTSFDATPNKRAGDFFNQTDLVGLAVGVNNALKNSLARITVALGAEQDGQARARARTAFENLATRGAQGYSLQEWKNTFKPIEAINAVNQEIAILQALSTTTVDNAHKQVIDNCIVGAESIKRKLEAQAEHAEAIRLRDGELFQDVQNRHVNLTGRGVVAVNVDNTFEQKSKDLLVAKAFQDSDTVWLTERDWHSRRAVNIGSSGGKLGEGKHMLDEHWRMGDYRMRSLGGVSYAAEAFIKVIFAVVALPVLYLNQKRNIEITVTGKGIEMPAPQGWLTSKETNEKRAKAIVKAYIKEFGSDTKVCYFNGGDKVSLEAVRRIAKAAEEKGLRFVISDSYAARHPGILAALQTPADPLAVALAAAPESKNKGPR